MSRSPIGSYYKEARLFALKRFSRLSPEQKLRWLSDMAVFVRQGRAKLRLRASRKRAK